MKKWVGGLLAIGLVVAFFAFGRFGCLAGNGWGMGWGWGPMMGPGGGMFMGMILLIVLIVAVVWWITKGKTCGSAVKETPLEILKRRYAAGEITKEQFEATKKDLQG
jgi:putative membrane protein